MSSPQASRLSVWGKTSGSFGDTVSVAPSASSESGLALVVGAPLDDEHAHDAGEVTVYRWDGTGFDRTPIMRIGGDDVDGEAGQSAGGAGGYVVWGAPWSDLLSPDSGAVVGP